ncbi:unnamed protein product [Orchesella dallaii]|uniref:Uncharacterized protein n=1 Tax=Orchesella dallaii TaxID=48710 RepID=A0ABP1Q344_9HEXA
METSGNSGARKHVTRDYRNEFHPYQRQSTKDDLHCVFCGITIRNGRVTKMTRCPRKDCNRSLPFTAGYGHNGWGRCINCWTFTYREYCYCENCGHANPDSIAREHRLKLIELQKQHLLDKGIAAEKEKENSELRDKLAKAEEALKQKEEKYFATLYKRDQTVPATEIINEKNLQAEMIAQAETAIIADDLNSMDVETLLKDD